MRDLLRRIVDDKRAARARRRASADWHAALDREAPPRRDFVAALRAPGTRIVAEIKRRSPSAGPLREDLDPAAVARTLEEAGAAALSVLTDGPHFGGSLADLAAARAATRLPVLRKDFLLDPEEMRESRRIGADAALVIVRILDPDRLAELLSAATEAGVIAIVEAHGERDLDRAIASSAPVIGVNSRDLDTLEVDLTRALRLGARVPRDRATIAESGIRTGDDVLAARRAGFDAVLVGEALMRGPSPAAALAALLGREAT
jgi:indole-3-glycerol phosphate synthase